MYADVLSSKCLPQLQTTNAEHNLIGFWGCLRPNQFHSPHLEICNHNLHIPGNTFHTNTDYQLACLSSVFYLKSLGQLLTTSFSLLPINKVLYAIIISLKISLIGLDLAFLIKCWSDLAPVQYRFRCPSPTISNIPRQPGLNIFAELKVTQVSQTRRTLTLPCYSNSFGLLFPSIILLWLHYSRCLLYHYPASPLLLTKHLF